MQRKDRSKLWAFIGVIGLLLLALTPTVSAQEQPVFHIGVLDSERGHISNGARLAAREINATGGVRGADGTMFLLDLVIAEVSSGLNLEGAVQELDDANVVAMLGPANNDDVLNGYGALQTPGIPVLTPATGDTVITGDSSGLIFRSRAADALQGTALANYLINEFNLTPIATVQLDVASTARVVGFTTAASALGVIPEPALILEDPSQMTETVSDLVTANPAVVVAYGTPDLAATLYSSLRSQGWTGLFSYDQAFDPTFRTTVPFAELSGVVSVTSWAFTSPDLASSNFLNAFIYAYGEIPNEVDAAAYDSVYMIANALALPGDLRDNIANANPIQGVQGILNDDMLPANELSNNVTIVRLGELGAPEVLARYQGNQRLPALIPATAIPLHTVPPPQPTLTPLPSFTPTPQGVNLTVTQSVQNVRSGPGDIYPVLGQLRRGDTAAIIGANTDFTWVVINFRGTQGWLATYLLDVTGDLRSVPIIPTPPTPTPDVTATPVVPPYVDLIIVSATIAPNPLLSGQNFTVTITVSNIGNIPAGTFTVSGTFPPTNQVLVGTVPALAPGQTQTLQLNGILNGGGAYTTSLIIDPNNQVAESAAGEQNNVYNITYTIGGGNVPVLNQGSGTYNLGDTIDLEGNAAQGDANWNADGGVVGWKGIFGATLGVLGVGDFNAVGWQQIDPAIVNRASVSRSELSVGTLIGIITADRHRGVMQVTAVSDTQISVNYKVFNG
jgi:branched-chain amino acid transport system substrate-binding protein